MKAFPAVLVLSATLAAAGAARADATFGLAVAIAELDGEPVQSDAWLDEQVTEARRLFDPLGVHLVVAARKGLDETRARLESRRDRDVLTANLERGLVNVFVVARLRDVDEPTRERMGVCWRRGNEGKPYLIVSAIARPTVLAHELGHFFGNPHSSTPDNVMSYTRTGREVFFDASQGERVRFWAKKHVVDGWLRRIDRAPTESTP